MVGLGPDAQEMDGAAGLVGITVESGFLQPPCPAALVERDHAMRLGMEETGLDGPSRATAGEKGHETFKIAKDGSKLRRALLGIPPLLAQVDFSRMQNPMRPMGNHDYSFLE